MPITWPQPQDDVSELDSDSDSSLPSYPSSDFSIDDQSALIQEEWEESMRQIEAVLSVIILPFFGKWYGRRFAFWAFDRYRAFGWSRSLFNLALTAASS